MDPQVLDPSGPPQLKEWYNNLNHQGVVPSILSDTWRVDDKWVLRMLYALKSDSAHSGWSVHTKRAQEIKVSTSSAKWRSLHKIIVSMSNVLQQVRAMSHKSSLHSLFIGAIVRLYNNSSTHLKVFLHMSQRSTICYDTWQGYPFLHHSSSSIIFEFAIYIHYFNYCMFSTDTYWYIVW